MLPEIVQRVKNSGNSDIGILLDLVRFLRPSTRFNLEIAVIKMEALLEKLRADPGFRTDLGNYFSRLFHKRKFKTTLSETGIIGESGFISELLKRMSFKVLPDQPAEDTVEFLLTNVFYKSWDHQWIARISNHQLGEFLHLTGIKLFEKRTADSFSFTHLLFSVQVLSQQASAAGMNSELLRMVPEYQNLDSPFLSLQKELDDFTAILLENGDDRSNRLEEHYRQLKVFIRQCRDLTEKAVKNKERYGISFGTTTRILRLEQQLLRLEFIINFLQAGDREGNQADFVRQLIYFHAGKNRVYRYLNETTHLVAYQATQHTGKTGEHYITSNRKEYNRMFWSAAGGGIVIGFLCLFKMYLSFTGASDFGHAVYYSLNYAFGFILIYFLHFTVATKQPAMTAASLAKSLAGRKNGENEYANFAGLFARLFRSQFIAFCGNVFLSFPVALLIALAGSYLYGENFIPPQKTEKMLREIDPFRSSAIFHAGIAGFHLFFSGLLSGYVVNKNIHNRISYRFKNHPALVHVLSDKTRSGITAWYDKHLGGLTSNFWLGVFLGFTGTIGAFFGLDLDIRHITFAAGNFGLSLVGRQFHISTYEIFVAITCIGLIGFMNFSVSFIFSLLVALRARSIPLSELANIAKAVFQRFIYSPAEFFFPPPEKK